MYHIPLPFKLFSILSFIILCAHYTNVYIKTKIIIGVVVQDERYKNEPSKEEFPMFESLKLTIDRTLPYWNNVIVPQIK